MVDFPGVDDEDDTIGDLADLLITVAQIILFVVDYRYTAFLFLFYMCGCLSRVTVT